MSSTPSPVTTPAGANTPGSGKRAGNREAKGAVNMSLNHLLNFSLPPRQSQPPQSIPRRSRKTGNQHGIWNKEKYVNAQYRFVMNPNGDYTVHFADPDIYFQWQDILQVILPRKSALAAAAGRQDDSGVPEEGHLSCPICLSPPVAPRMTKCGHIYCFPCILHYLTTSENPKWNRCPICFDSVTDKQLKNVKWFDEDPIIPPTVESTDFVEGASSSSSLDFDSDTPRPGSTLHMRLMLRPQITTLALPRSDTWPSDALPPHQAPFHFQPDVFRYAKFMLATPDSLVADLTKDLDELAMEKRMMKQASDDLSVTFVEAAEAKVQRQIDKATALDTEFMRRAIAKAQHDAQIVQDKKAAIAQRQTLMTRQLEEQAATPGELDEIPEALLAIQTPTTLTSPVPKPAPQPPQTPTSRNNRQRRNLNPPPPSTSTYYYYQAASGAPIFLHPLDIRILCAHFGGYASFPSQISVRVEAATESSVDDDLRRRCKYLAHMPEGADVVFVEADVTDVVGGKDGLRNFENALRMRRAKREGRMRKDDRAKVRAEEREREKIVNPWGIVDAVSPPSYRSPSPVIPVVPADEVDEGTGVPAASAAAPTGAWGQRSFASAAQAASPGVRGSRSSRGQIVVTPSRREREAADHHHQEDWDVDAAWHDLEQRAGTGRKKRGNKLVVLGGSGGGAGRRR